MYFAAFLIPIGRMNGYIRPIRWKNKVWNTIWNALYFFGMVVAATLMEEILWNDKAFFLQPKIYLLNSLVVMVVALASMAVIAPMDIPVGQSRKGKVAAWAARIILPVVLLIGVGRIDVGKQLGLTIDGWAPVFSFRDNGAPVTMLMSYRLAKPEKPEGYSDVAAERILANYTSDSSTGEAAEESGERPVIIAIMNESFTDLGVLGDFASDSYLANWYAEGSYVRRGYVYSSVYGGGTCNSEFEFLTGDSIANIQASAYPYENYDLTETENIVKYLRDAEGYYTVAFHPYKADNWNRPEAYEALGFDIFLTQGDVEDPEYLASKISDASDYAKVEELMDEAQMDEKPLFLFNVTMQNHGAMLWNRLLVM